MMSINQIKNHEFTMQRGGMYKSSEVDSVFRDVNETLDALVGAYEKAKKENEELYRKMNVLADRIEEYKKEEDSVRTVLVTAQKMADSLVREAKETSREIIEGANAEAEKAINSIKEKTDNYVIENKNKADEYLRRIEIDYENKMAEVNEKAREIIDSAKAEAEKTISDAEAKSQEIIAKSNLQADEISANTSAKIENAQQKLADIKALTAAFKGNVVDILNRQLALFDEISVDDGDYSAEYYPQTYHVDAEAVYHPEFTATEQDDETEEAVEEASEAEETAVDEEISEDVAEEGTVEETDVEEVAEEDEKEADEEDVEEIEEVTEEIEEIEEIEETSDDFEDISSFQDLNIFGEDEDEDEIELIPEPSVATDDSEEKEPEVQEEELVVEDEELVSGSDYFDELMKNLAENQAEDRSILGERTSEVKSVVKPRTPVEDHRNIFTRIDLEEGLGDEDGEDYVDSFDGESAEQLKFGKDFDIFDDDEDAEQGTFFSKFKKK